MQTSVWTILLLKMCIIKISNEHVLCYRFCKVNMDMFFPMNMLFLLLKSQLPCIIKNVNDKLQLKFGVIWNSSHLPQEFAFNLLGNLHNLKALSKHMLTTPIIPISVFWYLEIQNAITIQRKCNLLQKKIIHVLYCPNHLLNFPY